MTKQESRLGAVLRQSRVLRDSGRHAEALSLLEKHIELDPSCGSLLLLRASLAIHLHLQAGKDAISVEEDLLFCADIPGYRLQALPLLAKFYAVIRSDPVKSVLYARWGMALLLWEQHRMEHVLEPGLCGGWVCDHEDWAEYLKAQVRLAKAELLGSRPNGADSSFADPAAQ